MKILLTMNLPYTRAHGGANKSNRSLAEGLAERGHEVRVVSSALATPSPITHEQFLEELSAAGVDVGSDGAADLFSVKGVEVRAVPDPTRLRSYLMEQARAFQPDWVLVSSEDQSQNLLDAALKAAPGRVVYLAHTPQMLPFGPHALFPGHARTELIGRAAAIITVSKFVADYIKQWAGFEAFHNHPPHFGPGPFPRLADFERGYVTLMNASAIKGLPIFLGLARALPGVQFAALPGYGTTPADLSDLCELPNVTLLRNREDLNDILRETRVLLMPSLWAEGFGMAAVDAMLRGIPVLASDFGGLVEAKLGTDFLLPVRPITRFAERLDENMLPAPVVPDQDIGPWLDALSRLLSDRELYERQSENARQASHRFVSGLSVAPLEEFLTRLAAQGPSPARTAAEPFEQHRHTAPTESDDMAGIIARLTPEQKALLMLRLQKKAG